MGKINSKKKGSAGELELAHFLTDHGHPARRGQQFCGTPDSPDVICESLSDLHIECKRTEKITPYKALDQASNDAGKYQTPIVFHRQNRREWIVILKAEDFMDIMNTPKNNVSSQIQEAVDEVKELHE